MVTANCRSSCRRQSGRIEEEEKLSRAVTDDESEKENHLGDTLAWADELLSQHK
jgi:hypothetical protein